MYTPTQEDLNLLRQSMQEKYVRIELLDDRFKIMEYLEGELISDSYTVDAEAPIRRTYNLSFVVKDSSFLVGEDAKIWFNRYIKIYSGIYSLKSRDIVWYTKGIYIYNEYSYHFDAVTNTLDITCVDLMAMLDGTRNGQLGTLKTVVPMFADAEETKPNTIREAIRETLVDLGGINRYNLAQENEDIKLEQEFAVGASVYEIIAALRDLRVGWETFFDLNGVFVLQKYPTCTEDPIILDSATISPLVISENTSNSFGSVYNCTELWGKCLDADHYADTTTGSGSSYAATISDITLTDQGKIRNGTRISINCNVACTDSPTIKINSLAAYPIIGANNKPLKAGDLEANTAYTFRYYKEAFEYQGQYQVHAVAMEVEAEPSADVKASYEEQFGTKNISYMVNPESPFCVEKIGMKLQGLSGGEFDAIYSDPVGAENARYQNWQKTRLQDRISLEMLDIPWLDVNVKFEYTSYITGQTAQYIVKSISGSATGGTMTVEAIKFYPLYPDII